MHGCSGAGEGRKEGQRYDRKRCPGKVAHVGQSRGERRARERMMKTLLPHGVDRGLS